MMLTLPVPPTRRDAHPAVPPIRSDAHCTRHDAHSSTNEYLFEVQIQNPRPGQSFALAYAAELAGIRYRGI